MGLSVLIIKNHSSLRNKAAAPCRFSAEGTTHLSDEAEFGSGGSLMPEPSLFRIFDYLMMDQIQTATKCLTWTLSDTLSLSDVSLLFQWTWCLIYLSTVCGKDAANSVLNKYNDNEHILSYDCLMRKVLSEPFPRPATVQSQPTNSDHCYQFVYFLYHRGRAGWGQRDKCNQVSTTGSC